VTDSAKEPLLDQYTSTFLANSFALTHEQARGILDKAKGDRDTAAEMARQVRYKQP
jgi:hypothetical protein